METVKNLVTVTAAAATWNTSNLINFFIPCNDYQLLTG